MAQRWFDAADVAHDFPDDWVKNKDPKWKDEFLIPLDYARRVSYPSASIYLDGVVKGDQAQIDAYIAACLAVKAKYPKP
jgi:hypothetical protein